jgi:uroporphyrin-III C-methyltransferase/precorrin-2 dehydrogenase/sirohydrochlorin ferrochelatase
MDQFPIFLTTTGGSALIVGHGVNAARKARLLVKSSARVDVVANGQPHPELAALANDSLVTLHARPFQDGDVEGRLLVIGAAEDDDPLLERIARAAKAARVPVNVVDRPDLSTFLMPAIVDRDPLVVAIGSGGAAPVLARSVRARIEAMLPARTGALARFADSFRSTVARALPTDARRRFWEWVFDGPVAAAVLAGDEPRARSTLIDRLNRNAASETPGLVQLVGVGPGDPDLLTFKALRAMQTADVVLVDSLVSPEILDCVRRDALRIDVGKRSGHHTMPQSDIQEVMVTHARAGKRVVRLKGGDPFLFGRGGEERAHLLAAGVPVEVVPGISAAFGCAAATGVPLTHRDHAQGVTFITGHARDGDEAPALDWEALSRPGHTVVVYMGVATAPRIAARLLNAGRSAATPCMVVENGTRPDQRTLPATLGTLAETVAEAGVTGPALLFIGEVCEGVARSGLHAAVPAHSAPSLAASAV